MDSKKGKKKAAGPAKNPRIITKCAEMEAKVQQIGELKVKFAGVAKALRPALAEMAGRTSQQMGHATYDKDGRRKAQYDALVVELEKVRGSDIARRVAYHETHRELKAVSVQHETLQEMTTIENQYRKKVDEIRESSLTHLRLSYMTRVVQIANGLGADLENLGQGSNKRTHRSPDPNGNNIARYKDTQASAKQHFYWSTKVMWDDWTNRKHADSEMASQGRILPRPYNYIQAEMIESGARGHRMELHSEREDKRPDSTWIGGMGKLAYFEAGEGNVGMA
ncbi:hypothetical protein HO173_000345 [Letharia columbiana]|uniref:Uncharacterized protein n=1 Tax=Letharia columbiana TaxID=112416 RepID=A0A8H6LAL5_9LECA|nr:uncharacterized protein HO173_000345 [Letharia columbiana]KAF6241634.1 hypothetical protein HO173_000345 [Letharia columbiana]